MAGPGMRSSDCQPPVLAFGASPRRPARLLSVMCLAFIFHVSCDWKKFQLKVVESVTIRPPSGKCCPGYSGERKGRRGQEV